MQKKLKKMLSMMLALVMVLSLMVPTAFANEENAEIPADNDAIVQQDEVIADETVETAAEDDAQTPVVLAEDPAPAEASFKNIADESGDIISLADKKTFQVMIPVDKAYTQEEADAVVWSLDWDKAATAEKYMDPDLFPNHTKGGDIADGTIWHTKDEGFWSGVKAEYVKPLFADIACVPVVDGQQNYLQLTFSNIYYWIDRRGDEDQSVAHDVGGEYMDMCGYFDLTATAGDTVLGTIEDVLVSPYDKFYTMQNIYAELDAMVDFAEKNLPDTYVVKESMGKSSGNLSQFGELYAPQDMPYLIIADSKADVDSWLAFTEKAESDPEAVLADIAAGKYNDIKVPVMYSNVHANETAAVDGVMAFMWMLLKDAAADKAMAYDSMTGFTADGIDELKNELSNDGVLIPELVKDVAEDIYPESSETAYEDYLNAYLGYIHGTNRNSAPVDFAAYYNMASNSVDLDTLLEDVFFILVPEENVDGRTYLTRESSNGYDLNRDNSFQTTAETQNMQKLIGTFNPVSLMEFHGRGSNFQVEPCSPPHEPNFEYDLLNEYLMAAGIAFGNSATSNNEAYNSFKMPMRDYLYEGYGWSAWDDMSTSYTPQFAMLHGTIAYTVELPAYNDHVVQAVQYGCLGMSNYIAQEKIGILTAQTKVFARGVNNENSNETVNPWLVDQADNLGAEADLFRPVYDGEGENGNFYPEFYIIPLDAANQSNLDAAYDMMAWLSRNDVKILVTEKDYTYDGVTYPAGTMIISMYQAKRSVANGALYDGTFITSWDALYSEGITAFNETRGFDMVTVAKTGEIDTVLAACGDDMDYAASLKYIDKNKKSQFSGTKNADVIISNASEASTAAVNALLQAGKVVGMIDDKDSEFYGDFICNYNDYLTVADKYTLTATGITANAENFPAAKVITKAPTVYLTGEPTEIDFGFIYTNYTSGAYEWNYDDKAMEMMNFNVTSDAAKADVLVGASALDDAAYSAILEGTPYIGYGCYSILYGASELVNFSYDSVGGMDLLAYVTYEDKNLINGSYVMDNDDMLYNYNDNGVCYFTALPEGAEVLVKVDGTKAPVEGFIPILDEESAAAFDAMMDGGVLGFSYTGKAADGESDITVALFANSLTHKVHQRDEYAYISNFVFSNLLGEAYEATEVAPPTGDSFSTVLWLSLMALTAMAGAAIVCTKKQSI